MDNTKNKYAFISYSHKDIAVAKWLQRKLESYKLPTTICNEFEDSKYLRPIFRDSTDLNSGILSNEIRNNLRSSKFLIIICSPNSSKSKWVSDEVRAFIEWGRLEYIIPFIIDGVPNSGNETECMPYYLSQYFQLHPEYELLGIDYKVYGREQSFIRVVSRMLGLSFDELWKRHERERRKKIFFLTFALTITSLLFYYLVIPVSLVIDIQDDNHSLPTIPDAQIVVNKSVYKLDRLDTTITIKDLPGYYRGKSLQIIFSSTYYTPINRCMQIGFGLNYAEQMLVRRDSTFAIYSGKVVDEEGICIPRAYVHIGELHQETNEKGEFKFIFTTIQQSEYKQVEIYKKGYHRLVRQDECPSENLGYILKRE